MSKNLELKVKGYQNNAAKTSKASLEKTTSESCLDRILVEGCP
jgi:hypothetical protein